MQTINPNIINPLSQLTLRRNSTASLIDKIKAIHKKLTYQGIERINSTTLFQVKAKHTNEFTVEIGAGYFAEVTADQAVKLYERRLKNLDAEIAKLKKVGEQVKEKNEKIYGKVKTAKLEEGNKKSYMEVIGEENGEEIFNIVEIEGEEDEPISSPQHPLPPTNNTKQTAQPSQIETDKKQKIDEGNGKEVTNAAVESEESFDKSDGDDEDNNQAEKSEKSQKSDDEPEDLIQYHRKKILGIKPAVSLPPQMTISSTPELAAPMSQPLINENTQDPAKPEALTEKKKKRVSFADERDGGRLAEMLRKEQEEKDKKQQKDKKKGKVQKEEKQQTKPKKQQKSVKQQVSNVEKVLSGKVSKFKLQRMKQRLQKSTN